MSFNRVPEKWTAVCDACGCEQAVTQPTKPKTWSILKMHITRTIMDPDPSVGPENVEMYLCEVCAPQMEKVVKKEATRQRSFRENLKKTTDE
jgi:hypothetical protein